MFFIEIEWCECVMKAVIVVVFGCFFGGRNGDKHTFFLFSLLWFEVIHVFRCFLKPYESIVTGWSYKFKSLISAVQKWANLGKSAPLLLGQFLDRIEPYSSKSAHLFVHSCSAYKCRSTIETRQTWSCREVHLIVPSDPLPNRLDIRT